MVWSALFQYWDSARAPNFPQGLETEAIWTVSPVCRIRGSGRKPVGEKEGSKGREEREEREEGGRKEHS